MSINGKHAYRFVYLKSEQWQNVRLEALVRGKAKCEICAVEDVSNDAHHVYYPKSFWDTTADNLVVLCRPCHNVAHAIIKIGTKPKDECVSEWRRIIKALTIWRAEKTKWLEDPDAISWTTPKQLRDAYEALRDKQRLFEKQLQKKRVIESVPNQGRPTINGEKMAPKQLRDAYNALKEENKSLRNQLTELQSKG